MKHRITSLFVVLGLTALLAACAGKGTEQLPPPESPAAAARSDRLSSGRATVMLPPPVA